MEFKEVIKNRFSTRKFSDKKVEKEILDQILEAGNLAPTAKNIQPQRIFVVQSEEWLEKIDKVCPCRYNAQTVLVVCADKGTSFHKQEYSTYEMDASIVTTHMMLAATNLGVDNIWIEMFDQEELSKMLNLPEEIVPVCILNLGYKTDDCPINPLHYKRKDISEIVKYL